MHDILEGVIPLVIKLTLGYLHENNIVKISTLNGQIEAFDWGENDKKSKLVKVPTKIVHEKATLPGKAVEKWCLFRFLPILVGHFIPEGDQNWELYLTCQEIVDIILAPTVKKSSLLHPALTINGFLQDLKELYPGSITPKVHFLVHYPRLIEEYGPLRNLWCMRFEGKHQYFKRVVGINCNFKNIAKSLAKRHQLCQCWEFNSPDVLNQASLQESRRPFPLRGLPKEAADTVQAFCGISPSDPELEGNTWVASKLVIDNTQYSTKDFLIVGFLYEENIPVFAKVAYIIQLHEQWILCTKLYVPEEFKHHYFAYSIVDTGEWMTLAPGEEQDYHALSSYTIEDGTHLIVLHHAPCIRFSSNVHI